MRKSYAIIIILIITLIGWNEYAMTVSIGIAGRTGSPGETSCVFCHSDFAEDDPSGFIQISSPDLNNWQYTPGQTYQINVTITHPPGTLFGFGFESLNSANTNAGTFIISNPSETQLLQASNNRRNVAHTYQGGLIDSSKTFSFSWIAPAAGTGNVTFYTSGTSCNHDNTNFGDYVFNTSQLVEEDSPTFTRALMIDDGKSKIYPNPVLETFSLKLSDQHSGQIQVALLNAKSEFVHFIGTYNNLKTPVNLELTIPQHLAQGSYFLKIQSNRLKENIRLMKL
jgi:hypothetical protein